MGKAEKRNSKIKKKKGSNGVKKILDKYSFEPEFASSTKELLSAEGSIHQLKVRKKKPEKESKK